MFDWVLNTPLNTTANIFLDVSKLNLMTFWSFFSTINFSYQYLPKAGLLPLGDCFCSTKKYFTNKILKKKWKQLVRKSKMHSQNKNLITVYTKSLYPFMIKNLFVSLFSASYDILKTRLETMQSYWGFVYHRNYFSHLVWKK